MQTTIHGFSGDIIFDRISGARRNFTLKAYQTILNFKMIKIGSWSSEANQLISIQKSYQKQSLLLGIEKNVTYRVISILEEPFLMLKNKTNPGIFSCLA